jgi:hypothetical protein
MFHDIYLSFKRRTCDLFEYIDAILLAMARVCESRVLKVGVDVKRLVAIFDNRGDERVHCAKGAKKRPAQRSVQFYTAPFKIAAPVEMGASFPTEYMAALIVLGVVVVLALLRRKPQQPKEEFANLVASKPTLWWIVDVEQNARSWLDFGGRKTAEPNRGYLQLALKAAQATQGADFDIKPLIGRDALLSAIGDAAVPAAAQLPAKLWRSYAMAALLEAQGGLVMDGASTLCVGPRIAPHVRDVPAAVFGVSPEEPVVGEAPIAPGPAPYVGWAAAPHHPAWAHAAAIWTKLVVRGPQAWTSAEARRTYMTVFEAQRSFGITALRDVEGGRTPDGRPLNLEDLFGRVATPADPKTRVGAEAAYVSYDGDMLSRQHEFKWVLRMSTEQILASEFVWARLAASAAL